MSFQTEKDKLKNMSFKDKLWYLVTYYKYHLAAFLIVLAMVVTIVQTVRRNSMDVYLNTVIINNRLMPGEETRIKEDFQEYIGLNTKAERISLNTDFSINMQEPTSDIFSYMAKISVWVASSQLDVMVSDSDIIDHYAAMTGFWDLSQVLPDDLQKQLEGQFYYAEDEAGNMAPYGVIITDSYLSEFVRSLDPPILSIVRNTENLDHAIRFLTFLFE